MGINKKVKAKEITDFKPANETTMTNISQYNTFWNDLSFL